MTSTAVEAALREQANPEKAAFFPRFFKTGPGEYGEGDQFIGVVVPEQRKIARRFRELPLAEVRALLLSEWHECRLTALLILVGKYEKAREPELRRELCEFYLSVLDRVNNWDLVDSSAHKILGPWLRESGEFSVLDDLAGSGHLWRERVSVIATMHFLKFDEFEWTLALSERFLDHPHDLMHKACGWVLREAGKKDVAVLRGFLEKFVARMPRTMLRYAIEKLDKAERQEWMSR